MSANRKPTTQETFSQRGYFRKSRMNKFTLVDPEYVDWVHRRMARRPDISQAFAAIGNLQPSSKTVLPMGLGYMQAEFIGDECLPVWVGGADEKADYPTFGKEQFFAGEKTLLGVGVKPPRLDIAITWATVTVDVHGNETIIDDREGAAAAYLPVPLDRYKAEVQRSQLGTEKENEQATLLRTAANYASGYSETLSGNYQWDNANSLAIDAILAKREKVRKATRSRPDLFWLGPDALTILAKSPQVIKAVQYAGTKTSPAGSVPVETLVALFGMSIISGEAGVSATYGAAPSDIWGVDAGILCSGRGQMIAQRLGITVSTEAYPFFKTYRDESVGPKGALVQKASAAWKLPSFLNNTAGYLWKATGTAL